LLGVLNIIVALSEANAKAQAVNTQNVTPVHKACIFGQLAVVKKLIELGANMNSADSRYDYSWQKSSFPLVIYQFKKNTIR